MLQFTRQLERAQVAQLQLKQDLANQQVQAQLRIAQVGETAHRDTAQLTQSNDMLKTASTHLASNVRQALDTAEGMAGITTPHLGFKCTHIPTPNTPPPALRSVCSLIGSKLHDTKPFCAGFQLALCDTPRLSVAVQQTILATVCTVIV